MPLFSYTVRDKEGKIIKGLLEAESENKAIENFHNQGYIIISIKQTKENVKKHGKIKTEDLVIFSRQFTTLIESNIPIVEAMSIMSEQTQNLYFKNVLNSVLKDLKEGLTLSGAFSKHQNIFPELYISMVEAAEASGNLSEILDRVSNYLEKSNALQKKIKSSMYYPIGVVVLSILITSFLVFNVVPTFKNIFATLGGTLPLPTQILIGLSDFLKKNIIIFIIFIGGIFILFKKYTSTPKGKKNLHKFLLKLPIFGDLIRKIAIAKFSRTFATLIRSGVSIIKCLDIVAKTSGNKIIEEAVIESKKLIEEGQSISVPLQKTGVFPIMVIKMISIGEKSGKLEEMLSKIAQFYEEQTDSTITGLSSLIEPVIIVFLGVIIGGIVIALFLPIIKITQYVGIR